MSAENRKPGRDGNPLALRIDPRLRSIRDLREHPIDLLRERDIIAPHHYTASLMFLADWESASISPLRAAKLEKGVDNGSAGNVADAQIEAMRSVGDALSILSNVDRAIVLLVLVHRLDLKKLTAHMRREGFNWNNRVAGPRLCEALEGLAGAYGLTTRYVVSTKPIEGE